MPVCPVTDARLKAAASDSGWLMYRRDYASRGYAPFKTIDTGNVANLKPAWDWKSEFDMGHEAPPIVNGDYLFITTPKNHLIAFQASTGKEAVGVRPRPVQRRPEDHLLRRGQSRRGAVRGQGLHGHPGQPRGRAERADRRCGLERAAQRARRGLCDDPGPAGGQGQGDRRRVRRRVRRARLHRGAGRQDRQAGVEAAHHPAAGRAGRRHLAEGRGRDRRRRGLADRQLRRRHRHPVLGVGNPGPWLATLRPATICTPTRSSR